VVCLCAQENDGLLPEMGMAASWVCVYMCSLFEKLYFLDHDT
jgi:hypothetical protein